MVRGTQAQDLFNQIMGKTLTLLIVCIFHCRQHHLIAIFMVLSLNSQKNVETYVQECYDSIAMFLAIQLILRFQILCHKRCVPALDQ